LLRLWGDDLAGARADCSRAIRLGRESGLPSYVLTAAAYLAEAEYRPGEWDNAASSATWPYPSSRTPTSLGNGPLPTASPR
jgi:hypothetical protein